MKHRFYGSLVADWEERSEDCSFFNAHLLHFLAYLHFSICDDNTI